MDVFKLYDQFTTNWGRIRTNLTSHFIAGGLLWLIGFRPPLPAIGLSTLYQLPTSAIPPVLQGVGVLALASIAIALLIGAYGILLAELGYFLDRMLTFVFPMQSASTGRPRIPRQALLTFAGTLEAGRYEASGLEVRISELHSIHGARVQEGLASGGANYGSLSRDGTTHYRNAAVFLLAWSIMSWTFEGSALAAAVDAVFWRGFAVLALYFFVARARLKYALKQTSGWFYQALSEVIEADDAYAARLAGARRNPGPYLDLVREFEAVQARRSGPAFGDYMRRRFARPMSKKEDRASVLDEWRRFGSNEETSQAYDDPTWLASYAKWRIAILADRSRSILRVILLSLGLQPR